MHVERSDVTVVGGGFAGIATAIALRRRGVSVTIIERSDPRHHEAGEVLVPEARVPLAELGLWDDFVLLPNARAVGRLSSWGATRLDAIDHVFNPYGPGWIVSRQAFKGLLENRAERVGARLLRSTSILKCRVDRSTGWRTEVSLAGENRIVESAVLVSATGRIRSPARERGDDRTTYDSLVALAAILPRSPNGAPSDHRPLIEAVRDGWWYSVLLPDCRTLCAVFSDSDILRSRVKAYGSHAAMFADALRDTSHTAGSIGDRIRSIAKLRVFAANTCVHMVAPGSPKLNVGDASFAVDPLSGQGIYAALEGACRAALAIDARLNGRMSALREHEQQDQQLFRQQLKQRAVYYRLEQRWPTSPFWRRRHEEPLPHRSAFG